MADDLVLIDYPLPHVKRVTLNRPEKRNALFHPLRGAIMDALREGDMDDDIKVMIVRGNGPSFSRRLRPRRRQRGPRVPALHRARRGPVAAPRDRDAG